MWKCVRCNKENQDSAEKCINCGHGKTMDYTGHRSVSKLCPEMTNNWKKKKEKSLLMADCMGNDETVFGSKLLRKEVCKIDFVKMNLASIPSGAWDVSEDQDRTIWAWKRETPEGYTLYIGSEKGVYANKNCEDLFCYYLNVKKINFNNLFDTSHVTNMVGMFSHCESLIEVDLSNFDTRNVTNMEDMFGGCKTLQALDVSRFDTGSVENMYSMFKECESLEELDVSRFDTKHVENMTFMFEGCKNLKNLDVSKFNTGSVKSMYSMFSKCESLEELDVSRFDTRNVIDMRWMFYNCFNLTQLDTSNFYYAPDVNIRDMFTDCGVSKDNTAHDSVRESRTLFNTEKSGVSKEYSTESQSAQPPTLPVGCYYAGGSIKEICADFLSHQKNAIFNNGRKDKQWVLCHALEIPSEEKIYLLHDASINSLTNLLVGKIAVTKAEGFAITDKGIYMKKEYDKRKVFMPWERLKEANIDIDSLSNVRVDEIPVAFSRKNSVDRAKLQELVYLFSSIRRLLNRRRF